MSSDTKARLLAGLLFALSGCALACSVFTILHTGGQGFWQVCGGLASAGALVAMIIFFATMLEGPEEGDEDLVDLEEEDDDDTARADWWKTGGHPPPYGDGDEEDD